MNLNFITQAYGAAKLALQAKAPTLLVVGGITSMAAGTVIACKQTLQVEAVLEKHVPELEKVKKGAELQLSSYGPEAAQNDRLKVYTRVALDGGKLYAVPAILWVGGAGMVFSGHRLLLQRNATLAIAFTTLKGVFDKYRANVRDEFGEKADQAMLNGFKHVEIVDSETGAVHTISTRDWEGEENDPYNRIFDQYSSQSWQPDLGVNKMFIAQQQRFAQELLVRRGYLYLSEVYRALGFEENDISRVVGWKVKKLADGSRDIPLVDFGLDRPLPDDWKYSKEKAVYLDFNCQGLIIGGKIQKILEARG